MNASENREVFEQRIMECEETIKSYRDNMWSLSEQLLDAALVPDWNKIIKTKTATSGYIAKGGIYKNTKRGRSAQALEACICTSLLRIINPNAA